MIDQSRYIFESVYKKGEDLLIDMCGNDNYDMHKRSVIISKLKREESKFLNLKKLTIIT